MLESYKVVLLGESDVGKLDIINTLVNEYFNPDWSLGLSSQFIKKRINLKDDKAVNFDIWENPGQEKYRSLGKIFYKDAKVIIFVYDITNKKSFDEIKNYWYEEVKKINSDAIFAVVGNKCDLYDKQQVSNNEGEEFAKSINAFFALTTNKSDTGVKELFEHIAKKILDPEYDYIKAKENEKEEYFKKRNKEKNVNKDKSENKNELELNLKEKDKGKCIIC